MGIVNIDDTLHDQLRRACTVSSRSINAQANFWIRVGMLCEMNPTLSFQDIVAAAAGTGTGLSRWRSSSAPTRSR